MARLADYFAVVGYDHEKEQSGSSFGCGKILQRFPEKDWEDVPFISGIELFCQPGGWKLLSRALEPTFFIAVLTDIEAERHYCAVLTFSEAVKMTPTRPDDVEDEMEGALVHHTMMFAPKSLVLISRLSYFETLKNCLGLIYTAYIDSMDVPLETLVGNILGHIQVPPASGPQNLLNDCSQETVEHEWVRFSIGAGDRQALQPPLSDKLPITGTKIAMLMQQLGIRNVMCLYSAAITDQKILFHSSSYTRLTEACTALLSLLYPLKYSYVYIPILPAALTEVLSTPTPFIMGVHSSMKNEMAELMDVIIADLDGGCIMVPECINLYLPREDIFQRSHDHLTLILNPELKSADLAFPKPLETSQRVDMTDKEIRAIFLRLQAELLMGYRSCLTLIRIHPEPVITFNKGLFLFERSLVGEEFLSKVLDSMSFSTFVNDKGPPYRVCDIFDKLVANISDTLNQEEGSSEKALKNIRDVGDYLYINENPTKSTYLEKIPRPTEGAHTRINQMPFPRLKEELVGEVIEDGLNKAIVQSLNQKASKVRQQKAQIVPAGPKISSFENRMNVINNSARRLEVLRTCIGHIFDNRILDAKKLFPAVLRSLKSRVIRQALVRQLALHVQENRSVLEQQQFDMVVRLINCALQEDSCSEEYSLSMALLPLITAFCRKLCTGVIQFAYSCTQDHPVWASLQFWETAFYQDVETNIRQLYMSEHDAKCDASNGITESPGGSANGFIAASERSPLDIAAEQLRLWSGLDCEEQDKLVQNEESIVYSQAIHYANRMVCMRVPLDVTRGLKNSICMDGESGSSNLTSSSVSGSDSYNDNHFDNNSHDVSHQVVKFICRFVDKVCTEAGVASEHLKNLHTMIPGMVAMHIETLDAVNRESKRLPPIKKPKILKPTLLPGERQIMDGLRGYLLPDGREDGVGGVMGGPAYLPAEGAIFLTSYRVIFKGTPIDIQACEQVVTRSFPVSALYKEKKINVGSLANSLHLEQFMSEGLQIRSVTFQLIKIAFDEEVGAEKVEAFRKNCVRYRYPQSLYQTFAFHGSTISPLLSTQMKQKEKSATLRKFATKTFLKGKKAVGVGGGSGSSGGHHHKSKLGPQRKDRYVLPAEPLVAQRPPSAATLQRQLTAASMDSIASGSRPNSVMYEEDELSNLGLEPSLRLSRSRADSYDSDYDFDSKPRGYRSHGGSFLSVADLREAEPPVRSPKLERPRSMSIPAVIDETDVTATLKPIDVLTVDKLQKKLYVQDYYRLGFGSPGGGGMMRPKPGEAFRISEVNIHFEVTRSYPSLVVVPSALSDDSIRRLAKCHRQYRFPAITWRHPSTKALLLRSSGFHSKGVMGMISRTAQNPSTSGSSDTSTSKSLEQEKYFTAVVLNTPYGHSYKSDSLVSLNSILPPSITLEPDSTPNMGSRKGHSSGTLIQRGFMRSSGGKSGPKPGLIDRSLSTLKRGATLGKLSSFRSSGFNTGSAKNLTLAPNAVSRNGSVTDYDLGAKKDQDPRKAALYIFGEKSQSRPFKLEQFNKCDFIPYDFHETRQTKHSLKKLMKACVPSTVLTDPECGFHKLVDESEWLVQIQSIMQLAGAAVDLMDLQGSSVMFSFEEGWDFTTQVVSLAQILMDPYYRTLEGFQVLIEKEWLAFGHRFTHRSNQTMAYQASGFAPVFLQFLDCVHQVHTQFPMSFEFNQYFLKMIAFHHVSNRFQTFMLDSEYARFEAATQVFEDRKPTSEESGDLSKSRMPMRSFWEYILKINCKQPLFYNLMFAPHTPVLRPYTNISSLRIWDFFTKEDLAGGPSFDRELFDQATAEDKDMPLVPSDRRVINNCYDNVAQAELDMHMWYLEEMMQLEGDLGRTPQHWKTRLDRAQKGFPSRARRKSLSMKEAQQQSMSAHKKTTIDILVKGKNITEPQPRGFAFQHRFEAHSYMTPTDCDLCSNLLFGAVKQGCKGMKCLDCGYNAHEDCVPKVPKQCTRRGSTKEPSSGPSRPTSDEVTSAGTPVAPAGYELFYAKIGETRTHEGYLYKRGARLKGWKQRWFVLDSQKHQLRYYETRNDPHYKGIIDLKEVESVQPAFPTAGAPKKCDDNAFFDLKTTRRAYNFVADTKAAAEEWISRIQDCVS
ncbi:myotubularin-related protein 13-like isoform X3 [Acanthaster planci]|uniref:Myotubularin-related protein 13-like isoform X3 n=1 Tax=Acanthaster planci TaxID=133434 RepID=A0A8B7Y797_ACAPL|nr:myotubularin-related protein 13-like isoform X3 [Acanthaster planci]